MQVRLRVVSLFGLATLLLAGSLAAQRGAPPILPDASRTPGDVLPVTKDDVCVAGYSQKVRNVPSAAKPQVYASYGITSHKPGEYEVDHLISLELGGSNSVRNLWPESYVTSPWNARVKDALENELHRQVCEGKITLKQAQDLIAHNWIASYKKIFHTDLPKGKASASGKKSHRGFSGRGADPTPSVPAVNPNANPAPGQAGKVWVNTASGKYFHAGAKYYGKTKEGQYMSEAQAKQQGFIEAKGQ